MPVQPKTLPPGTRPTSGQAAAPDRRVLLVDDQPFFLAMGQNILRGGGYTVQTAAGGAEALETVRKNPPDLILLDVEMPGMDGFQTLRRLKGNPATQAIPVAMLTATLDPKLNQKAFQAGAEATILKSMSAQRLLNMVQVILTTARATEPAAGQDPLNAIL